MPITAAYTRYSTDLQRQASSADQLRNIRTRCAQEGWPDPIVYADEAISGARSDRPEFQRLLADIEAGRIDVLLVDELSRLGRDLGQSWRTIKLAKYHRVRVIGVVDGTDTDRRGYKLETGLRGLMAEHYLDDLAEKTHRGLTGLALQGYSAGGLPYGYRSVATPDGHRREIDQEQAQVVRRIYEMAAAGLSARRIAAQLNKEGIPSPRGSTWAVSAIYGDRRRGIGILGNPIYVGRQIWNRSKWVKDPETGRRRRVERPESEWITNKLPELRIVSDDLWRAAGGQRTGRWKRKPGRPNKYLFSGLLRCGECGAAFVVVNRYSYGCSAHKDRGTCSNNLKVTRAQLEATLLPTIQQELLSDDAFREFERAARQELKNAQPDTAAARRALARAEKERDNILRAIRAGILTPSTRAELEKAEDQVRMAQRQLREMEAFTPAQFLPRAREIYQRLVKQLASIKDIDRAREALRDLLGQEIRMVPENDRLVAEIQGQEGKIIVVAGAGFGCYLTQSIRIPMPKPRECAQTDAGQPAGSK